MEMTNRRTLFGLLTATLLGLKAKAQPPAKAGAKELSRQALTGPQEGLEAILVEVTSTPGSPSMAHRHPGFVMGYVLEGQLKFAIDHAPPSTIPTGGTFYEPQGALHTSGESASPSAPVRFLAFIVAPKGSPVVLPA